MRAVGLTLLTLLVGSAAGLHIREEKDHAEWGPWGHKKKKHSIKPEDVGIQESNVQESAVQPAKAQPAKKVGHSKAGKGHIEISQDAEPVFYAVIMGNLAYRHQASLWLSSLRVVGRWVGTAVMVTDKPDCLATTLGEAKLLGDKLSSDENVDIYGPPPNCKSGCRGNLHIVKRPPATSINKMKLEKARGWLNIKVAEIPHPVSSIIYTDEDVVIGKDIAPFVTVVKQVEREGHTLALFRDTGASRGELHTGVVIMFPGEATDDCLQAWGKKLTHVEIGEAFPGEKPALKVHVDEMDGEAADEVAENEDAEEIFNKEEENVLMKSEARAMGPDQQALGKTSACKANLERKDGRNGIKILPKDFFWLPKPHSMATGFTKTFVHFTNTGRWKSIPKILITQWLVKIGVPDNIDPTGRTSKECAIPEGGTIADVKKDPSNYKR